MLSDFVRSSEDGRAKSRAREEGRPLPPLYHPVTLNPTGDPAYIDGQVADILAELQEGPPLRPFVEGEMIPGKSSSSFTSEHVFNMSTAEFTRMADRVWADHRRKSKTARRQVYVTLRKQQGRSFRFTWTPDQQAFKIEEITQ